MEKTIHFTVASLLFCIMLSACVQSNTATDRADRLSVVTTIFAPYDFVREIAGDKADITMLLPPASESHSYEPTPQDIIKIQNSDIFVYVGGDSDSWVRGVLSSMDSDKIRIITLMDCVEVVEKEIVEGMEDDHDHEHDHSYDDEETEYDEHVWTSPKNAKLIVQKIADALCEADASNAALYRNNTVAYLNKLDELDIAFKDVVNSAQRKTIVFGDRFPFRYLTDAYGIEYFAAFPGCASETEASAKTVAFLIDKINAENIPVIFHAELSNKKMANTISEATGADVLLLHACHNITKDDFQNGVSYLDIMSQNVIALKEALQ